jgi:hypothetical protein
MREGHLPKLEAAEAHFYGSQIRFENRRFLPSQTPSNLTVGLCALAQPNSKIPRQQTGQTFLDALPR